MESQRDRLDSWKEIADYLGRDRTTVMRWERTAGLPVRRIRGERGMAVFAYRSDLDQWLLRQPAPPEEPAASVSAPAIHAASTPSRTYLAAGIAAALMLVLATGLIAWTWRSSAVVSAASLVGREIVAVEAGGREVWRVRLPHVDGAIVPARILVEDLDEDGVPEVLAGLNLMRHGRRDEGLVMLIDGRGQVRWQRTLDDRYTFGDVEYGPTWFPVDIAVYRQSGAPRIAVAYHHHTWWPGLVVTFDGEGTPLARFVNAGWLTSLNVTADSRYLLAAGHSNSLGGAMLAVLDTASPAGASPDGGSLPPCANCPDGRPASYFFTPWTDVARPSDTPPVMASVMPSGLIEWRAIQRAPEHGKAPEVIVTLSPELEVIGRSVNDFFRESRERWEQPQVRQWTSTLGWRSVPAAAVAPVRRTLR